MTDATQERDHEEESAVRAQLEQEGAIEDCPSWPHAHQPHGACPGRTLDEAEEGYGLRFESGLTLDVESGRVRPHSAEMTPRDHVIRAIHQYADWLTNHPEVEPPRIIEGNVYVTPAEVAIERERVDRVLGFALDMGATPHEGSTGVTAQLPVVSNVHVRVVHTMFAPFDDRTEKRYVK